MKFKFILLLLLITIIIPFVYSAGIAGQEYTYFTLEKCYGNVYERVFQYNPNVPYELVNCTLINDTNIQWNCPCTKELKILTPANTISSYAILIQYNLDKPHDLPSSGNFTNDDLIYNSMLKRVYTITNITLMPYVDENSISESGDILNTLLYLFILFIVLILIGLAIWGIFYALSDKIKRWLGMNKDDKLTLGSILRSIFSRKKIEKRMIGKTNLDLGESDRVAKPIGNPVSSHEKQNKKITNEDVAKSILEDFNK